MIHKQTQYWLSSSSASIILALQQYKPELLSFNKSNI